MPLRTWSRTLALTAVAITTPAVAQDQGGAPPFTGFYVGLEAGGHEHHVFIEEAIGPGQTRGRYYRGWGFGGGAFVGHDFAVSDRIRVGVEGGVSLGGKGPEARFADGSFYTSTPRWGYRATARAGYLVTDKLLAFGTFGYGGHFYKVRSNGIANPISSGRSFTIGGGFDYRLKDNVSVRLDFRHLDNQMSSLLIGVPIRF